MKLRQLQFSVWDLHHTEVLCPFSEVRIPSDPYFNHKSIKFIVWFLRTEEKLVQILDTFIQIFPCLVGVSLIFLPYHNLRKNADEMLSTFNMLTSPEDREMIARGFETTFSRSCDPEKTSRHLRHLTPWLTPRSHCCLIAASFDLSTQHAFNMLSSFCLLQKNTVVSILQHSMAGNFMRLEE